MQEFTIKLKPQLVQTARQMHLVSRVGDERRGPNQSFEYYLSDLVAVAIIERRQGEAGCRLGTALEKSDVRQKRIEVISPDHHAHKQHNEHCPFSAAVGSSMAKSLSGKAGNPQRQLST
jgi:hypothetical protein